MELGERIQARARVFGVGASPELLAGCVRYLELLTRWNRRINLTALSLDPPTDATLDRLLVEPLVAIGCLPKSCVALVDIGSGAGSPAIPMKLGRPGLGLVMYEARHRKAAFLREAARVLGLSRTTVETRVFGEGKDPLHSKADAITVRAVALATVLDAIDEISTPGASLTLFLNAGEGEPNLPGWTLGKTVPIPSGRLAIFERL
jgi:16S rRNA (guanine527-N7)-methyltransferase